MNRTLLFALMLGFVAVAGCFEDDVADDDQTGGSEDVPEDAPPAYDPAPMGRELTEVEIQEFALVFSDEPLTGGQDPWPSHLLKWINDDVFLLMHMNNEDPIVATQMLWWGMGVRGVFCAEDQPTPDFTHFHKYSSPTYAEGHGGEGGEQGYWLMHLNVREFESPFGPTGAPGLHEEFGPTPAPECGSDYARATHDPPASDGLQPIEIEALKVIFDDQPLRGGQEPWPSHLLKWVSEETFILVHFDQEAPGEGGKILWMGLGVRGTFCQSSNPGDGFTHFHRANAATYAEGHGGEPNMPGYWLMHVATHNFESPFGQTGGPGIHREFGPTPASDC